MACVLGIDLGTSSIKALLVDGEGRILATTSADYPLIVLERGDDDQYQFSQIHPAQEVNVCTLCCSVIRALKTSARS